MRFRHIAPGCVLAGAVGKPAFAGRPAMTPLTRAKPRISVSSPATDIPYGAEVTLTVTLGPTVADRRVALYATPFGQAREQVAAGAVNAERNKANKSGNGTAYDVFHGTGTLTLHSTVAPNSRGECLEPETEQYDKGFGWDADTKYGCDKLNRQSRDAAPFSLSLAVGDRYRIRGDFLGGKDAANLSAQGRWLYFTVTK